MTENNKTIIEFYHPGKMKWFTRTLHGYVGDAYLKSYVSRNGGDSHKIISRPPVNEKQEEWEKKHYTNGTR